MKYRIVRRLLYANEYLEVFDSRLEAEAACKIYEKLKDVLSESYETLEGESFGGVLYFADPQVPEGWLIALNNSAPSA